MNNVLYVLGAGFPAPLGLPVISNFLAVSKDIYQLESGKYAHFSRIFDKIDRMGKAKSYVNCDLFNIEEILSILEMESYVTGADVSSEFTRYIADVISYCTPPLEPAAQIELPFWAQSLFHTADRTGVGRFYYEFVARLFNLQMSVSRAAIQTTVKADPHVRQQFAASYCIFLGPH